MKSRSTSLGTLWCMQKENSMDGVAGLQAFMILWPGCGQVVLIQLKAWWMYCCSCLVVAPPARDESPDDHHMHGLACRHMIFDVSARTSIGAA